MNIYGLFKNAMTLIGLASLGFGSLFFLNSDSGNSVGIVIALLYGLPYFLVIFGLLMLLWVKVLSIENKLNGKE